MKTSLVTAFALLCLAAGLVAQPDELKRTFADANRLYLEQKYDSAIVRYRSIIDGGAESGGIYFNLGNAYYRLGKISYAILNYERARTLEPDDEDIQFNLQLANLRIPDRVDPVPTLFVYRWADAVLSAMSPATMAWVLYALFVLLLAALSTFLMSRRFAPRRISLIAGVVCVVLLVLGGSALAYRSYRSDHEVYAIVIADVANIKAAPDAGGNDLFVIHGGLKVQILDTVNDWQKIRLADGKIGWIPKSDIEPIAIPQ